MKYSENWLRRWVDPTLDRSALANLLTLSGLEVEEIVPAAKLFHGVIVGEVLSVADHPDAKKLHVCQVTTGSGAQLNIVCGAANVRAGIKVAVAVVGATVSEQEIKPAVLRGVPSAGMLCSAKELSLAEESEGILILPADAPIGAAVWDYLALNDHIIEIGLTPNRGDCLSIQGLAREVAALTRASLIMPAIPELTPTITDELPIQLTAEAGCPRYAGRIIRHIKRGVASPIWLKEALRRSGIRSISPVVDVTNYVMLELGQPMHAFDQAKIQQGIQVRLAKPGEKINLLDGSEKELDAETLVIADQQAPLALAGVMGGVASSVTDATENIFLESAYFAPRCIARQRQYYALNSDSAYRFERGIDPTQQRIALERATELILQIVGGEAGPITEVTSAQHLPQAVTIEVSAEKINATLGAIIPTTEVSEIFQRLNFTMHSNSAVFAMLEEKNKIWEIKIPAYRSDITLAEDVIEEIARLYGYDRIPTHALHADFHLQVAEDKGCLQARLRQQCCDLGYHEMISYSFISKKMQNLFDPDEITYELLNPISTDMAVMRTNLWPGLVQTFLYNHSRQQQRIRLFEIGTKFLMQDQQLQHVTCLGGLISGAATPEQWSISTRASDFFDLKGDVENILQQLGIAHQVSYQVEMHPALHPGQSARIYLADEAIGWLGLLHPSLQQALDATEKIFLFEINIDKIPEIRRYQAQEISKFPEIRRDIAIIVSETVPADNIQATIRNSAGDWLKGSFIFDLYQGKGIPEGQKSIALALLIQHPTRTLVDDEATEIVNRVVTALQGQLGAKLRS